jgi:hypothetical protein
MPPIARAFHAERVMLRCSKIERWSFAVQYSSIAADMPANMADILRSVGLNSNQGTELAAAATEVVFRRMTLGGAASLNPTSAHHDEFARMVPEKTQAFSDAGSILFSHTARFGQELARLAAIEASTATATVAALLTSRTPGGMVAAHADAALAWVRQLAASSGAMCLLALEAQGAVLAPIHRTATDNVERLRA